MGRTECFLNHVAASHNWRQIPGDSSSDLLGIWTKIPPVCVVCALVERSRVGRDTIWGLFTGPWLTHTLQAIASFTPSLLMLFPCKACFSLQSWRGRLNVTFWEVDIIIWPLPQYPSKFLEACPWVLCADQCLDSQSLKCYFNTQRVCITSLRKLGLPWPIGLRRIKALMVINWSAATGNAENTESTS